MKNKIFYGWVNVLASAFIMFVLLGLGNSTLSQFLPLMAEELSVNLSQVSLLISFSSITIAILGALIGPLMLKFGAKRLINLGIIFYCLSLFTLSISKSLPLVYLSGILMGAGITYATSLTLSTIITAWFVEKRGLALGIVFAASGIGGTIFNPIMAKMILSLGYRKAFLYEAIFIFVICTLASIFLVKSPKEKGQEAYGKADVSTETKASEESLSLKEIYKSMPFILLLFSCILFSMAIQPTMYNFFPHYLSVGYDQLFIAKLLSIVSLVNILAKLIIGYINDKFGLIPSISIGFIGFMVCDLAMLLSNSQISAYLAVIAYGFALTMVIIPLPLIVPKLFGVKHYAQVLGVLTAFLTIGSSVGTPMSSLIFDKTGSFKTSFVIQGVLIVVSYILFVSSVKSKKTLNK